MTRPEGRVEEFVFKFSIPMLAPADRLCNSALFLLLRNS